MKKLINNIPNIITMSRIVSCVMGATFFTLGNIPVAVSCYVYGAVSDAVDGFLARKLNAVTELGKKLDPISDKLFALSLMAPAIILGNALAVIPFVFEGVISGINVYAELKYKKTYTEKVGKLKTIMLFPTMILGLMVTKNPNFAVAFVPMLFLTSKLQVDSIIAYSKQLDESKKKLIKVTNDVVMDDCDIKNIVLDNEVEKVNGCIKKNDILHVNSSNRIKKLIRKKDYNDRY